MYFAGISYQSNKLLNPITFNGFEEKINNIWELNLRISNIKNLVLKDIEKSLSENSFLNNIYVSRFLKTEKYEKFSFEVLPQVSLENFFPLCITVRNALDYSISLETDKRYSYMEKYFDEEKWAREIKILLLDIRSYFLAVEFIYKNALDKKFLENDHPFSKIWKSFHAMINYVYHYPDVRKNTKDNINENEWMCKKPIIFLYIFLLEKIDEFVISWKKYIIDQLITIGIIYNYELEKFTVSDLNNINKHNKKMQNCIFNLLNNITNDSSPQCLVNLYNEFGLTDYEMYGYNPDEEYTYF